MGKYIEPFHFRELARGSEDGLYTTTIAGKSTSPPIKPCNKSWGSKHMRQSLMPNPVGSPEDFESTHTPACFRL